MPKFTPGPWKVRTTKDDSGDYVLYLYDVHAFPYGYKAGPVGICHDLMRPGDANLIAVAPDMYTALKYARRFLNKNDHDIEFIDNIIAKAEGNEVAQ